MKKAYVQSLLLIAWVILFGADTALAQNLHSPTKTVVYKFLVDWDPKRVGPTEDHITYFWKQLDEKRSLVTARITTKANVDRGTYEVVRTIGKRNEKFGFGEQLVQEMIARKELIEPTPIIDYSRPYMLCRNGDKYRIETYVDTTEIDKLFQALNQIYYFKAIPRMEDKAAKDFTITNLEFGRAFTSESRGKCSKR